MQQLEKAHLWLLLWSIAGFGLVLCLGASFNEASSFSGFGMLGVVFMATTARSNAKEQTWMRERIALLSQIQNKALFWVDDQGALLWMNELAEGFLGREWAASQGLSMQELLAEARFQKKPQGDEALSEDEKASFWAEVQTLGSRLLAEPEGTRFSLSRPIALRHNMLLLWEGGMCLKGKKRGETCLLWEMRDLSRESLAENFAQEARFMVGTRFVLGSLIHELNNDLNCVFGAMDLVEEAELGLPLLATSRQLTQNAVMSALQTSSKMAMLIRKPTDAFVELSLVEQTLAWLHFLKFRGAEGFEVDVSFSEDHTEVLASPTLLRDLFSMLGEVLFLCGEQPGPLSLEIQPREVETVEQYEAGGFLLMPGEHLELRLKFRPRQNAPFVFEKLFALPEDGSMDVLRLLMIAVSIVLRKHQGALFASSVEQDGLVCWTLSFPRRL
ncbi:MAG: hypothetical protein H6727_05825 [Myxococcales bacterium]|nr:hypothetical protein [Myxococcales bacterium]